LGDGNGKGSKEEDTIK